MNIQYDVIVIGAGAAGLMAASTHGKRGKRVLLLEHTDKIGEKIRISGGGRCNFTNLHASPANYLSQNKHFAISALKQYSQHDFIKMVETYKIAYHEKTLGQLFCDTSSKEIIQMLVDECNQGKVEIKLQCNITNIEKDTHFQIETNMGKFASQALVIASGGLAIPKIGATSFGYHVAKKFGHKLIQTKPALVPLNAQGDMLEFCKDLSGISQYTKVSAHKTSFEENILFAHFGLTGPAILQISSYLPEGANDVVDINLFPNLDVYEDLLALKNSKLTLHNFFKPLLKSRLLEKLFSEELQRKRIADFKNNQLLEIANKVQRFKVQVNGTQGYAKAEVTAGGVDTKFLSSRNMESTIVPGLFFIGEVVDVTGWLGGYNFQWAWSSGFACAQTS